METPTPAVVPAAKASYAQLRKQYTRRGLIWLIGPMAGLITVLIVYAIATFIVTQYVGGSSNGGELAPASAAITFASLLRTIMGLVGIVAVVLQIIGVPVGIAYLTKHILPDGVEADPRSGTGGSTPAPVEVRGWNWGAAGLPVIWGASHAVWVGLLALIPLVNIVWWIVMGVKGNEWAWHHGQWASVEEFKAWQNKWKIVGIVFFVLMILGTFGRLSQFAMLMSSLTQR